MSAKRGNRQQIQSTSIASLIPLRGMSPLQENVGLCAPSRVSDVAIVMGIRLVLFVACLSLVPGIVWLFSL
jgi:hypothetical protein